MSPTEQARGDSGKEPKLQNGDSDRTDRMEKNRQNGEKKITSGETRLSRGASSPLARILLFIYCLLIVLITFLNVLYFYFYIVAISNNNSIM